MKNACLLIDADGLAFRAATATHEVIEWDDEVVSVWSDLKKAKRIFSDLVNGLLASAETKHYQLCWSCSSRRYFRHDLLPSYKGHRKTTPPVGLGPLKKWALGEFPGKMKDKLEADDVLGIFATHPKMIPGTKIIWSPDKDLDQVPGLHLGKDGEVYKVSPAEGHKLAWLQTLTGDATDGYKGCPGVGAVKANKLLNESDDYEFTAMNTFLKAGLGLDDLQVQHNVARILTAQTYDFKKGVPILWEVPVVAR